MSKISIKKISELGLFILFFIIFQIIQYNYMFGFSLPKYFFLDLMIISAFSLFIFIFKKTIFDKIYFITLMTLIVALAIANVTFIRAFGDIFSLYNLTMVKQGAAIADPTFFDFVFISIVVILYIIFIILLFMIDQFVNKKITSDKIEFNRGRKIVTTLGAFALIIGSYSMALGSIRYVESDYGESLKDQIVTMAKNANFKKYGTLSYYVQEIDYLIDGAPLIDDIDMINYFDRKVDTDNEFTGLLKNMNVVTIMIETGDRIMVNETLTPNLYKFINEGINCENNYSKNKTNVSEFIGITGSAPTAGVNSYQYEYELPYSVPNMMPSNYRTIYVHDVGGEGVNDRDIYSRKNLIPELDFEEYYFHEDLLPDEPIWSWGGDYVLDSISLDKTCDKVFNDNLNEPFYLFYTSLSMHGPYVNCRNEAKLRSMYGEQLLYAKNNGLWVNPLEGTINENCLDVYMMEAMDFDVALGNLIQRFKDEGVYDNTLFYLYGDHDLYYNGEDDIPLSLTINGYDEMIHSDMYDTVMVLSNPKLNKKYEEVYGSKNGQLTVSQFTSPYNVAPTILDLLGVKYNANFYMGNSIFSPQFYQTTQVFYSIELSSFFNLDFWTFEGKMVDRVFNENANAEEFLKQTNYLMNKQAHMDVILTNNYFVDRDFSLYNYR